MPITWFEPVFPFNLIYDLGTYSIISLIFVFLYKIKIIKNNLLFLSLVLLLTPFLFNGLLFDWSFIPDQSKYLYHSFVLRDDPKLIFDPSKIGEEMIVTWKIHIPSIFYSISPIITFETYKGIAIVNRAIFLLTWIFFIKKKILDEYSALFFLLTPSLIFYSSVALRDILVVLLMFWFIYFYFQKKKIAIFITITILYFIKYQMLVAIGLLIIFDIIIKDKEINLKFLIFLLLITSIFGFFFNELILDNINFIREGFYLEEYGGYNSMTAVKTYQYAQLDFTLSSLIKIFNSFLKFTIPPAFLGIQNLYSYIHLLEISTIFIFMYFKVKSQKNFSMNILAKWLLILFFSYLIHSIVVFNPGSSLRYKVPMMFFVIFGYCVNVKLVRNK